MRSTGYLRKTGVAGGCYPPLPGALQNLGAVAKSHTLCRGRQLGDPLRRSRLGFPRGEAAERSEADEGWRQVGQ